MKLNLILIFIFISATTVYAKEDWLCVQESSQIQNGTILACGIGEGKDEDAARAKAFDSAKAEFNRLCGASDACNGRRVTVEPQRTTCEQNIGGYKCYRLLVFSLGAQKNIKSSRSVASFNSNVVDTPLPRLKGTPDAFKPFVYEPKLPHLFKGMKKKDLLAVFGAPRSISDDFDDRLAKDYTYEGKMCVANVI